MMDVIFHFITAYFVGIRMYCLHFEKIFIVSSCLSTQLFIYIFVEELHWVFWWWRPQSLLWTMGRQYHLWGHGYRCWGFELGVWPPHLFHYLPLEETSFHIRMNINLYTILMHIFSFAVLLFSITGYFLHPQCWLQMNLINGYPRK